MSQVPSQGLFEEGFKYWFLLQKGGRKYYCCRRRRKGCPAKFSCAADANPVSVPPETKLAHNHPPETDRRLVDNFRKTLTRRAATEKLDLHAIYHEEATTRHPEAAQIYTFCRAESTMLKARRRATEKSITPPETSDLQEVAAFLRSSHSFRVTSRELFFQDLFTRDDTAVALLFAYGPTVQHLVQSRLNEVQVNVMPLNSRPETFLLTMHHLDSVAKLIPLIYVLLSEKTPNIYAAVLAHVREKMGILPSVVISECLQDCLHDTLALTFPEASIKANWSEYVADVARQLSQAPQETFKKPANLVTLRMILVLPFLPADYMAPGLAVVRKWMQDNGEEGMGDSDGVLVALCRHVENVWLRGVGTKFSLFRVPVCAEDQMREFQNEVQSIAGGGGGGDGGGESPWTLWKVIERLTTIASKVNHQLTKKSAAPQTGNRTTRTCERSEMIIRNATDQWITQPIHLRSPLQFLQMASHFITRRFLSSIVLRQGGTEVPEEVEEEEKEKERVEVTVNPGQGAKGRGGAIRRPEIIIQSVEKIPRFSVSEPPPLAFFPRPRVIRKEPPPLVPIRNRK